MNDWLNEWRWRKERVDGMTNIVVIVLLWYLPGIYWHVYCVVMVLWYDDRQAGMVWHLVHFYLVFVPDDDGRAGGGLAGPAVPGCWPWPAGRPVWPCGRWPEWHDEMTMTMKNSMSMAWTKKKKKKRNDQCNDDMILLLCVLLCINIIICITTMTAMCNNMSMCNIVYV